MKASANKDVPLAIHAQARYRAVRWPCDSTELTRPNKVAVVLYLSTTRSSSPLAWHEKLAGTSVDVHRGASWAREIGSDHQIACAVHGDSIGRKSSRRDRADPLQLARTVELREVNRVVRPGLARSHVHDTRSRVEIDRAAEIADQVDVLIGIDGLQ